MHLLIRTALLTLVLSGLLAGQSVQAETTDVTASAKPASEQPKKCDRWEGKEQRLQTLKADLKLNTNQEVAWSQWIEQYKVDPKDWEERRKHEESWANLPAPERMEKMLDFSKEHIARQEARLAATKTFYALLSPEQRLVFDKGFNLEHHGRLGKREKK